MVFGYIARWGRWIEIERLRVLGDVGPYLWVLEKCSYGWCPLHWGGGWFEGFKEKEKEKEACLLGWGLGRGGGGERGVGSEEWGV